MSLNLHCGWSMQPLRRTLRLIHLLNVSWRKRLVMTYFVFYVVVILLMMYDVLDFESKNLIAENKRSYLPHVVDFSKFFQIVVNFSLFPFFIMIFERDKSCFWYSYFSSHRVQVLRQALFMKIFLGQKWIVFWIKLLKT